MAKVVHVHLTHGIDGTKRRDWYFSSISAVILVGETYGLLFLCSQMAISTFGVTLGVAILEVGIVLGLESGVSFYKNWG